MRAFDSYQNAAMLALCARGLAMFAKTVLRVTGLGRNCTCPLSHCLAPVSVQLSGLPRVHGTTDRTGGQPQQVPSAIEALELVRLWDVALS